MEKNIGISYYNQIFEYYVINRVKSIFPKKDAKILDIGIGAGKYGKLLKDYVKLIDGVEVFEETLQSNPWLPNYYNNIFIQDAVDFQRYHEYDIVIFGDVLEHIEKEEAQKLLKRIYNEVEEVIVLVPFLYKQGALNNNPYEIHKQSDITNEIFLERFEGFRLLFKNEIQGIYVKDKDRDTVNMDKGPKGKNKVAIYTISKNEEKYVDVWMDSMSEADYVVVMDTGSTDRTVEKLRARGAIVETRIITPWRFDHARNESIKLIPKDAKIAFCTDLDEFLLPNWYYDLSNEWQEHDRAEYRYSPSSDFEGRPLNEMSYGKIHANNDEWKWIFPVHEHIVYAKEGEKEEKTLKLPDSFYLRHNPDYTKSRRSYIDLIEFSLREYPNSLLQHWYYVRELFFYGEYQKSVEIAIKTLFSRELEEDKSIISAVSLFLGLGLEKLGRKEEAEVAFLYSIKVFPAVRTPHLHLMRKYYDEEKWYALINIFYELIKIERHNSNWGEEYTNYTDEPHDLASMAFWNLGDYQNCLEQINIALSFDPENERYLSNKKLLEEKIMSFNYDK